MVNVLSAPFPAEFCEIPLRKTNHRASFSWEERRNQLVILASLDLAISFLFSVLLGRLESPTRDILYRNAAWIDSTWC